MAHVQIITPLTGVQKKHNLRECATEEGKYNGTCSI